MKEYRYESLESDEVRLLELFFGDPGSELHGRLERFRLPENEEPGSGQRVVVTRDGVDIPTVPTYEALSYVWGHDMKTQHSIGILQNDELCYLPIKPNLHDALLRLRSDIPSGKSRTLWVDVLCIHQVGKIIELRHAFADSSYRRPTFLRRMPRFGKWP